jgi:CheY-like chemotaxis protein
MTLKLLVADDSVTIQKIVRLAFSAEDVLIESVSNGDDAMDAAREFKPDVVLADVLMPGCSGYEVCERIKGDPEFSSTPVILLVGTFEPFDESEASRVGCDAHLTKPFDTLEMIETVRSLAGEKWIPNDEEASESAGTQPSPPLNPESASTTGKDSLGREVWESYLGDASVLEIFDRKTRAAANVLASMRGSRTVANEYLNSTETTLPADNDPVSEKLVDMIADRVVRRISSDIIREVAWEVVPELSEVLIRRVLEEDNPS